MCSWSFAPKSRTKKLGCRKNCYKTNLLEKIYMKIGYPCINLRIGCTSNSTFRLSSYSTEKIISTVTRNLDCLKKILAFNLDHHLLFFRIGSSIIPFASHPICTFDWKKYFRKELISLGEFIKKNRIRISMHPDQFILINTLDKNILSRSVAELQYHCDFLDAMKLDYTAKVQIHVGGIYGDKVKSLQRFIQNYQQLPKSIKKRLVLENDDRLYSLKDCLMIHENTNIPIVFDHFHHQCLNHGESTRNALKQCITTWHNKDGNAIVDYSSQQAGKRKSTHASHINIKSFKKFLAETQGLNFDIMLEIKDKEKSALKANKILKNF
jgi:UV DNA damage endonuclease